MSKLLSFPNIAYLVAGFVLVIAILLLIIFLSRQRRVSNGHDNTETVFENAAYELEGGEVNDFFLEQRCAINMLYMAKEECQDSYTKENNQPLNDMTEC